MFKRARVRWWRRFCLCAAFSVGAVPALTLSVALPATAGAATSATSISTLQFVN